MKCEDVTGKLPLLEYAELSFEEEEDVQQHLEGCGSCQAELARVKALQGALDSHAAEVDAALLVNCRRRFQTNLAAMSEVAPARHPGILGWFRDMFTGGFSVASPAKPLGAMALIAIGFFGAHLLPSTGNGFGFVQSSLTQPVTSRVRYVEPNASGNRVQIVVEEVSQRTLSGTAQDDQIQRLLLAAAREGADPGLRVESMDLLKSSGGSNDVRNALIFALQHDPNPGVRLKALEGLRNSSADGETRKALSAVLLKDDNPGVRIQVIDLLIQKKEPAMVGVLQEVLRREDNDYVRLRCQKALHEMKASIDTF